MAVFDKAVLLAAIRECVTVVEPGDVLAVRVSPDTDDATLDYLGEDAERIRAVLGVRLLLVAGEEFARLKAGDVR